jgi:hypothetical protein
MSEILSYGQRVRQNAKKETALFTKRRLIFGVSMAILIRTAVWLFGKTRPVDLVRDLLILIGSYLLAWLASYLWNLFCAPGRLDKDRGLENLELGARLLVAEALIASNTSRDELVTDFAKLQRQGQEIEDRTSQLSPEHLINWDTDYEQWKDEVKDFLTVAGWHTELVPFSQAGDKAAPVQGIENLPLKRERRRRRMILHNEKLEDIARRRIIP